MAPENHAHRIQGDRPAIHSTVQGVGGADLCGASCATHQVQCRLIVTQHHRAQGVAFFATEEGTLVDPCGIHACHEGIALAVVRLRWRQQCCVEEIRRCSDAADVRVAKCIGDHSQDLIVQRATHISAPHALPAAVEHCDEAIVVIG